MLVGHEGNKASYGQLHLCHDSMNKELRQLKKDVTGSYKIARAHFGTDPPSQAVPLQLAPLLLRGTLPSFFVKDERDNDAVHHIVILTDFTNVLNCACGTNSPRYATALKVSLLLLLFFTAGQ